MIERPYISQNLRRLVARRADSLWANHFQLRDACLNPLTDIGDVTARILGFNDGDRLMERQILIDQGKYPHPLALHRMQE